MIRNSLQSCFFLFNSLLLFLFSVVSIAQDGHYWTQQYGTRSMLLSGSIIGGVNDLGAVYYNPARLSQISEPAFLLSADVYEWNTLKVEDAFGNNKNASNSNFGGVPSLAAGTFKIPFLKKHSFAWAILLRQNMDLNISYKDEVYEDVIEQFPGEEYFGAEISLNSKGKQEWMGFSWAYPITEKLSVGASGYLSTINTGKDNNMSLQALAENNQVAIYRYHKKFSYSHYNLLFKTGLSYMTPKTILGLTFLTPSIRLKGEGNFQDELFFSGIEEYSENDDVYKSSYQNELETKSRSPWSVGAGITQYIGKSKINISAEYFSNIPKYTVMKASDYFGQSAWDTNVFELVDEFNKLLNAGIGVEIFLAEKLAFYTSFCTDFSAVVDNVTSFAEDKPETSNSLFKSDFYHFGGGFVMDLKGADVTLGVTHTGATLNLPRPFSFPEDEEDEIFDPEDTVEVGWSRWRIVFSFSLPFLKDVQKKAEAEDGVLN